MTRTNYLGSVWATRAFLPLLERGAPAHLVNIVSVAGTVAYGPSGPYAAAKHAQIAFSRSATIELRQRGRGMARFGGFLLRRAAKRELDLALNGLWRATSR